MGPTPRLLLAYLIVGLTLGAIAVAEPRFAIALPVGWAVVTLLALADLVALARSSLNARPSLPPRIGVGEDLSVNVRLRLASPVAHEATVSVEASGVVEVVGPWHGRVMPGGSDISLVGRVPQRGPGGIDAVWTQVAGPLGLIDRVRRSPVEVATRVVPSTRRVQELALAHFGSWSPMHGARLERHRGDGTELDSLVAYEPGMDLRSVDWKTSARHQSMRVRRFRLERNQHIIIAIDVGRTMTPTIENLSRVDHAIHAALLLADVAIRAGDWVGLYAYASRPVEWVPPSSGRAQFRRIADACAALTTRDVETNHVLGLHELSRRLRRRSLVAIVSDFVDTTTAELMTSHVAHAAKKHLVVFTTFNDRDLEAPGLVDPSGVDDMARAVVASGWIDERQRVLRRLERSNVSVVQGPPGPASIGLLRRYLEIKRKALLG